MSEGLSEGFEEARKSLGQAPVAKQGRRQRRWFKGFGAIAKGGVLISVDGGLLIAGAAIDVAEPSSSAALLGSLGMGFNDVASGVGDLRGE